MNGFSRFALIIGLAALLGACATGGGIASKDYTAYRAAAPRSIVVVPVINHSQEVEAADLFLSTLPIPLAERGYYIFPINMVKGMMEQDGLADPMLVHTADTTMLAGLFGADAVLYVEILDWRSQYNVLSATIIVDFLYTMKDGRTGQLLWQEQERYVHAESGGSGNIFADLIATAITAAADSMRADYTPLAQAANATALLRAGQGIPFGPYSPAYGTDGSAFPANGNGRLSDATVPAAAADGTGFTVAAAVAEEPEAEESAAEDAGGEEAAEEPKTDETAGEGSE